jgi:hypothetical protein
MRSQAILLFLALGMCACDATNEPARSSERSAVPSDHRARCDLPCEGRLVTCASLREIAGATGLPAEVAVRTGHFQLEVTAAEYDDGVACDGELLLGGVAPECVPATPRLRICGSIGWSDANADDDVGGGPRRMYPIRIDAVAARRGG